ncbi:hypothetical protein ACLUYJ_20635, partial [Acinetobacter baumannii]
PKGFAGQSPAAPARAAPTAFSGSNVLALATASATALRPSADESTAYKRDYEERAKELAEDIAVEESADQASDTTSALFTDAAAREAADAK